MFTHNGLKKVPCTVEGKKVVIDGLGYEIICLKETTSENSKTLMVPVLFAVIAVIFGGEGMREFISGDKVGSLFFLVPSVLAVPLTVYLTCYSMYQNRCRSKWRINFFHTLYIERRDEPDLENLLKNLPVPEEETLPKPANQLFTKKDVAILIVLAIIFLLSFKGVVPAWSALMLPGYAAWLRIKDIIWDFKKQKWQLPTSH